MNYPVCLYANKLCKTLLVVFKSKTRRYAIVLHWTTFLTKLQITE